MSDIKTILTDAEDFLGQAANSTGERAAELYEKALACLKQAKDEAAHAQIVIVEKSKKAVRAAEDYMNNHPLASIGISACVGILIGLLINRK
ncbi:MAG: DUF883 family protein [Burkholderia sp.]|nr:DUF883 family protein [Burkholderia sp.]